MTDRLEMIFTNQRMLMETIIPRERKLDPNIYIPSDIGSSQLSDRGFQRYFRECGNRFIEELGEALNEYDPTKQWEELIDCLHFLTELSIIVDFNPAAYITTGFTDCDRLENLMETTEQYTSHITTKPAAVHEIIRLYGAMMNTLRSKPWKEHYEETATGSFYFGLFGVWKFFFRLMKLSGMNTEIIWNTYKAKNKVNFERQENGY